MKLWFASLGSVLHCWGLMGLHLNLNLKLKAVHHHGGGSVVEVMGLHLTNKGYYWWSLLVMMTMKKMDEVECKWVQILGLESDEH